MLLLGGCASTIVAASNDETGRRPFTNAPLAVPPGPAGGVPSGRYGVGPLDVLTLRIPSLEKAREVSTFDVEVDAGGSIDVPFVGSVSVTGKPVNEIRAVVMERLGVYLVKPQVTITVKEYRSHPLSVFGAVEKSGTFYLQKDSVTLTEALSMAGGLSQLAGTRAFVVRPSERGATTAVGTEIDLVALLSRADAARDIVLPAHSSVNVLPAVDFYVTGYVPHPGNFPFRRPLTVTQAVSLAGGVDERVGSPSSVVLKRPTAKGIETVDVDLESIASGGEPDLAVLPGDTVQVNRSFLKAVIDVLDKLGSHMGASYAF
jgi:polysaccharide export outer membrane protein